MQIDRKELKGVHERIDRAFQTNPCPPDNVISNTPAGLTADPGGDGGNLFITAGYLIRSPDEGVNQR